MRLAALCLSAMFLTGCSDKAVREYAAILAQQLTAYRSQIEQNLQAERQMYNDLAGVFSTEAERDVYETLGVERSRSSAVEARRLEGTTTLFDEGEYMRRRVQSEFDATHDFYLREMTLPEKTTAGLRNLEYNSTKLAALAAALEPFTRRPELGTLAADLNQFQETARKEIAKQQCRDPKARKGATCPSK